jgi:hypothetical protein
MGYVFIFLSSIFLSFHVPPQPLTSCQLPPGSGGSRGDARRHPFPSGWRVEGKNVFANNAAGNTFMV